MVRKAHLVGFGIPDGEFDGRDGGHSVVACAIRPQYTAPVPETTAVIGDRTDTDILGGQRAGAMTICVLSGASSRAEAEAIGADLICADIAELLEMWEPIRRAGSVEVRSGKL